MLNIKYETIHYGHLIRNVCNYVKGVCKIIKRLLEWFANSLNLNQTKTPFSGDYPLNSNSELGVAQELRLVNSLIPDGLSPSRRGGGRFWERGLCRFPPPLYTSVKRPSHPWECLHTAHLQTCLLISCRTLFCLHQHHLSPFCRCFILLTLSLTFSPLYNRSILLKKKGYLKVLNVKNHVRIPKTQEIILTTRSNFESKL